MTEGHRHRVVRVKHNGPVHKILTGPTLATGSYERASRSRFAWGPVGGGRWRLSPLGVLHGLIGLTLDTR